MVEPRVVQPVAAAAAAAVTAAAAVRMVRIVASGRAADLRLSQSVSC